MATNKKTTKKATAKKATAKKTSKKVEPTVEAGATPSTES